MARPTTRKLARFSLAVLFWALLLSVLTVSAQAAATPINVGENKAGEIVDPDAPVLYTLTVDAPMTVNLQVLAITPGYVPNFRVLDPTGIVILDGANPGAQAILRGSPSLLSADAAYTIEVSSANNTTGQFLISTEAGAPLAASQMLTAGMPVEVTVNNQTTRQAFTFSGLPDEAMLLTVSVTGAETSAVIALRDADSADLLSLSSARLGGLNYRITSGEANYLLEITHSGGASVEQFVVCLATESGSAICPGLIKPPVEAASCTVTSNAGNAVNLRSGNGTQYLIVGSLASGQAYPVLGQNTDRGVWYQVKVNDTTGWVAASVTRLEGDCEALPFLSAPVNAQLAPISPPVIQPTAVPPINPTAVPTTNPTAVPPPPLLPDLTINKPLDFYRSGDVGPPPSLLVSIFNAGTAPLTSDQTFSVNVCVNGFVECTETRVSINLAPGAELLRTFPLPVLPIGGYTLSATLNGRSEFGELDGDNNTRYLFQ